MLKPFVFKTHPGELILLQRKVELTLLKIIKVMVIRFTGYFMTLSKVAITDQERLMFTDWQKSHQVLLINVLLKEFHLRESMEVF